MSGKRLEEGDGQVSGRLKEEKLLFGRKAGERIGLEGGKSPANRNFLRDT